MLTLVQQLIAGNIPFRVSIKNLTELELTTFEVFITNNGLHSDLENGSLTIWA